MLNIYMVSYFVCCSCTFFLLWWWDVVKMESRFAQRAHLLVRVERKEELMRASKVL